MKSHANEISNPSQTDQAMAQGWSVAIFAEFWSKPSATLERIPPILSADIAGYWPGSTEVARGPRDYWRYIVELLKLVPDFRVRVLEHATNGDVNFLLWKASGTGPDGTFTCTGCDCLRAHEGIVQENRVFCEHPIFHTLARRVAATSPGK